MTTDRRRTGVAASGAALLLVVAGCAGGQDRLVYGNYQRIHTRISDRADVARSIGQPDREIGDEWLYLRPDQHIVVRVEFDATGRVSRAQWIDGRRELWEDTADPATESESADESDPEGHGPD